MSRSEVSFTNSHGTRISVAYSRWDDVCVSECGDGWDVLGWINLEPGQTQTRENPSGARWFYYYAEAADGTVYNGVFLDHVKDDRFQLCSCLGVSSPLWYSVGFDELDLDEWSGIEFL